MKDFLIQITPIVIIILSSIIFYRLGKYDTRNEAIKNGAAIWTIDPNTGKKKFKFLKNQNNEILEHLDEKDSQFNMSSQIRYVKNNYKI